MKLRRSMLFVPGDSAAVRMTFLSCHGLYGSGAVSASGVAMVVVVSDMVLSISV